LRILHLALRNYRNYGRLDLDFGPGMNLFIGDNGQGKTNLLESVAILALSTSPRVRRESELIGPLGGECRIEAEIESGGRRREIKVSVRSAGEGSRRAIEVDGVSKRALDLPGILRVTLFWPDDLSLIKSGPDHRRRLLNQMLVQIVPGYARHLARYARALDQRNRLLRQVGRGEQRPQALDAWDAQLAELGDLITAARVPAVQRLNLIAQTHHRQICGDELSIAYQGSTSPLLELLQMTRVDDVRRGATGVGPHRDDLVILIGGRPGRSHASQGQQRTAAVSMKLAEADLVTESSQENPVLLLDDVLSELDGERRRALLERLGPGGQTVITAVEADAFEGRLNSQSSISRVVAGTVIRGG